MDYNILWVNNVNTLIKNVIIYIKYIILYIVNIMSSCVNNNNSDNVEIITNTNIFCTCCKKKIKATDKIYCMYDKTFCTTNCRILYIQKNILII